MSGSFASATNAPDVSRSLQGHVGSELPDSDGNERAREKPAHGMNGSRLRLMVRAVTAKGLRVTARGVFGADLAHEKRQRRGRQYHRLPGDSKTGRRRAEPVSTPHDHPPPVCSPGDRQQADRGDPLLRSKACSL